MAKVVTKESNGDKVLEYLYKRTNNQFDTVERSQLEKDLGIDSSTDVEFYLARKCGYISTTKTTVSLEVEGRLYYEQEILPMNTLLPANNLYDQNAISYENDKDLEPLLYTELSKQRVLDFFFKKRGKVNINNLQYLVVTHSNRQIAPILLELKMEGLIEIIEHPYAILTLKARWERFRDNKNIWWIIAVLGLIAGYLALR